MADGASPASPTSRTDTGADSGGDATGRGTQGEGTTDEQRGKAASTSGTRPAVRIEEGGQSGGHGGGHGHSTAAWVGVGVILVGCLVMAVAVVVTSLWLFVAGVAVVALGAVAGKVMQVMGFGSQVFDREVPGPDRGVR